MGLPFSRLHRTLAAALVVAAFALLASAFLIGATPDEEEFRYTVLTSWLHVQALAQGHYSFWTSLLGFGVPQPLIANYWMHPLLPLLAFMTPPTWMRLLLAVHSILGAAGMWRLCRTLDIRPLVSAICAATFLLATPSQNYVLIDFWPSLWISLTSMPWVVLGAWRVLNGPPRHLAGWAAGLGLLCGLVIATGNPGNVVIYGVVALAVLLAQPRAAAARWRYLLAAGIIAIAMTAPNAVLLATEQQFFDPGLTRSSGSDPLRPGAAWDVFLRPLSQSGMPWDADVMERGARTLFFGGPFALLAVIGCLRLGWQRRDLAFAVMLAALPLFIAAFPAMGSSDRYLFRDPLILCAVPLAGMAADRGLRGRVARWPTVALLVAQLVIVPLAALPFLRETWQEGREGAPEFHGAVGEGTAAEALVASMQPPGRLLLSPDVDEDVRERGLLSSGIGVNALAYRGVPVVNGWFKGVSAGPIWPDERLFYARIRTPQALLESDPTLDVLGIRYVLAKPDERVAAGLQRRALLPTARAELVLYENQDAWPDAFLVDAATVAEQPPLLEGCENGGLLCRDLSHAAAQRRAMNVTVLRSEGAIDVTLDPLDSAGVLVLTEMFRPQWQASSAGTALQTEAFAGSLMAVRVPAGATAVHLVYRPWPLIAATLLSFATVIGCLVVIAAGFVTRRR